jgi:hypothetical protein
MILIGITNHAIVKRVIATIIVNVLVFRVLKNYPHLPISFNTDSHKEINF